MTQRETLKAIRALGLAARVEFGEYRVSYRVDRLARDEPRRFAIETAELSAYYVCDSADALATARAMAERCPELCN